MLQIKLNYAIISKQSWFISLKIPCSASAKFFYIITCKHSVYKSFIWVGLSSHCSAKFHAAIVIVTLLFTVNSYIKRA